MPFAFCNVSGNFRGANDVPPIINNRRNGERNVDLCAVLPAPDCFIVVYRFPSSDSLKNVRFFTLAVLRNEQTNWLPNHFLSRIAKQAFSTAVPALDDSLQVLADDRIVRG